MRTRTRPVSADPRRRRSADADAEPLFWGSIPESGGFTRARIERILALVIGLVCIVFGVQAAVAALGSNETGVWHLPMVVVVFGALAIMIVSGIVGRGARSGAGLFTVVFIALLVVWPFASEGSVVSATEQPWIWFLINIATVGAALAFPLPLAVALTVLIPLGFAAVRIIQGGGEAVFWQANLADVSFSLIFGFVLLIIVWMTRSVGISVDRARAQALDSYAEAAAIDAAEQERMELAALIHDSVLSALIAAERAESPRERELATTMAQAALSGLAGAEDPENDDDTTPVTTRAIAQDIAAAAHGFGFTLPVRCATETSIPRDVARALTLAAIQAVANAIQHADAVGLTTEVESMRGGCQITVSDLGSGMDLTAVPEDRLGIRGSIIARVEAVGGTVSLQSSVAGTRVTMRWLPPDAIGAAAATERMEFL